MSNSVSGFINNSVSPNTYTTSMSSSNSEATLIQKQIDSLKSQLSAKSDLSDDEKKEIQTQITDLQKELSQIQMKTADSTATSQVSSVFSSLSSSSQGDGADGLSSLLSASSTGDYMKALNSARITIENKSRTLTSEIAIDKARGVDTSAKEETLSNLTGNLSVLDDNLAKKIETALKDEDTAKTTDAKTEDEKTDKDKTTTDTAKSTAAADTAENKVTDSAAKTDETTDKTASTADSTAKTDAVTGETTTK